MRVELISPAPPPRIPERIADIVPPAAQRARLHRKTFKRLAFLGGIAILVYALIIASLLGELTLKMTELHRLKRESLKNASATEKAKKFVGEWTEFQTAINPQYFALDQLAAVAAELPGDLVRLTRFTLEDGHLIVSGEASDISQAYLFLEHVKKSQALQSYDWTSQQPQLVGKNKVQFDMEGIRPDAPIHNK